MVDWIYSRSLNTLKWNLRAEVFGLRTFQTFDLQAQCFLLMSFCTLYTPHKRQKNSEKEMLQISCNIIKSLMFVKDHRLKSRR